MLKEKSAWECIVTSIYVTDLWKIYLERKYIERNQDSFVPFTLYQSWNGTEELT